MLNTLKEVGNNFKNFNTMAKSTRVMINPDFKKLFSMLDAGEKVKVTFISSNEAGEDTYLIETKSDIFSAYYSQLLPE